MSNTIVLRINDVNANYIPTYERMASEVVLPGDFVGIDANGKWAKQASGARWHGFVTVENEYAAEGSTRSADIPYNAGEVAYAVRPNPGDVVRGWIADGQSVVIGDELVMDNATGKLIKRSTEDLALVVSIAEEAVTASGSNERCAVRIL